MSFNVYQGQIVGPFKAREELMDKIKADAAIEVSNVKHLGIQTDISTFVVINGKEIEVGKTGIYEIGNTKITSLFFKKDVNKNTIIDYTIE